MWCQKNELPLQRQICGNVRRSLITDTDFPLSSNSVPFQIHTSGSKQIDSVTTSAIFRYNGKSGALRGTDLLRGQTGPKTQTFAEKRLSQLHPLLGPQETADLRRKPKRFTENHRKLQIGISHVWSVTLSSAVVNFRFPAWCRLVCACRVACLSGCVTVLVASKVNEPTRIKLQFGFGASC